MAERRVVDHDVLGGDALGLQVGLEDLVGGARIDVVGAGEHPALDALLVHQVVDRRDRLLVRRGAGVEDVALALLALVLHRVEQDRVQLLEHRQHRLAADAGPAAEDHVDLLAVDQLAGELGEARPVGRRIDHHRLELPAEHAALGVLLLDQHQHDVLQRRLRDRHRARERVQDADLDRLVLRQRRRRRRATPASAVPSHNRLEMLAFSLPCSDRSSHRRRGASPPTSRPRPSARARRLPPQHAGKLPFADRRAVKRIRLVDESLTRSTPDRCA